MLIKRLSVRWPWRAHLRALGISSLKNVTFNTAAFLGVLMVYRNVPDWLFGYGFKALFLFLTYLFAEWTFNDPRLPWRRAVGFTVSTYVWDVFVSILIWSSLVKANLFFEQRLANHLIFFGLHALAMLGAWYVRKRMRVKMSLAEGLEA